MNDGSHEPSSATDASPEVAAAIEASAERAAMTSEAREALSDATTLCRLRWQLAELEIRSDLSAAKRLSLVGGAGLVLAIGSLPVVAVTVAGHVDRLLAWNFPWISLAAGVLLLLTGLLTIWLGWRRFRMDFLGLRESIAEINEDLIWLRELIQD